MILLTAAALWASAAEPMHITTASPEVWVEVGPVRASAPETEIWSLAGMPTPDFSSFVLWLDNPTPAPVQVTLSDAVLVETNRAADTVERTAKLGIPHAYFTTDALKTIREHQEGDLTVSIPPGKHRLALNGPGIAIHTGYHSRWHRSLRITHGDHSQTVMGTVSMPREACQ
jgi:hypothetical protein